MSLLTPVCSFDRTSNKNEDLKVIEIPKELYNQKPEHVIPRNVAGIYELIANDIENGTKTAPSFDDAVLLHELLDKIEKTSLNN